ncbi:MAG: glycosyltransferase family 2 protein, partial [Romboutsia sp.]|uniref:glycosyltransferase family 2 protein n=1 Tax=Romboutsia sp. TaxID=1965302 RepID=UPI003F40E28E
MLNILLVIVGILSVYCFGLEMYSLFLSLFGYKKLEKYYKDHDPEAKFLVLVAAHNEEDVIGSTLDNLKKIDYPEHLYDLYVVNDNSSDRTGEICDECNVKHIDTIEKKHKKEGVGKSAGLQYALRELGFDKLKKNYDMLLVLDADNHVDSNILKEVNSQWIDEGKPEAIQTYLDSKNAESTIATGYATAYNITNRFFQLSKKRLGLNNAIGGTGFAVRMDWLINTGGFSYKSLVEDLEMSIEIFKSGGRVSWNHFTRIYDEKPDTLKVSIKQRIRWCQGHWYVAFTNGGALLKGFVKSKFDLRYLDQLLYLFNMGKSVQLLVLAASFLLSIIVSNTVLFQTQGSSLITIIMTLIVPTNFLRLLLAVYSYIWLPLYANKVDGTHRTNPVKLVWGVFVVGFTYLYT